MSPWNPANGFAIGVKVRSFTATWNAALAVAPSASRTVTVIVAVAGGARARQGSACDSSCRRRDDIGRINHRRVARFHPQRQLITGRLGVTDRERDRFRRLRRRDLDPASAEITGGSLTGSTSMATTALVVSPVASVASTTSSA